ncbi:TPA: hypothetical protein ACGF6J_003380 [Vibrio cholerae]|uniref:hypothetical protein n=1 Tax=Vibrio cholerae TaxID=666 RepID=UPI001A1DB705|nr:hypothetical protein [Vibrio cholerae]MDV2308187.1 hypothetical protein [Vibrio cholerae]HAS3568563.1 hypothetical protein [Vibrio cholerae]
MEAAIWGIIGTIIGALASITTTVIASWNMNNLSNKAKEYEREEIAKEFQRQTILELQVELLEYFRSCAQIYKNDEIDFEKTGEWGSSMSDLDNKNRELSAKTSILIQRVADHELRAKLNLFKNSCNKCLMAKEQAEAEVHLVASFEMYKELIELIGKVLRSTYWQPNA